jgi:hypothetical protein
MTKPAEYVSKARYAARDGKSQKACLIIADAIANLSYADALEFVRLVKIDQGTQDLALLPDDAVWHIEGGSFQMTTAELREVLSGESFVIDWPSVYTHWGIMIRIPDGVRILTSDWALTETYLSS